MIKMCNSQVGMLNHLETRQVAMDEGDNVYEGTIFGHLTTYISLFLIVSFVILDICACCYYQVRCRSRTERLRHPFPVNFHLLEFCQYSRRLPFLP